MKNRAPAPGTRREDPLPPVYRAIIAVGSWLAPPGRRTDWGKEWRGEVWFALRSGRNPARLAVRTAWCLLDAAWLWRREITIWIRESMVRGMLLDLKIAIRSFVRAPVLTAVMVFTLALGIGATSAIFSIVDGVLLEDLPVPDPERLVWFTQENQERGITGWQYSYAQYRDMADAMETAELAVMSTTAFNMVGLDGPTRVTATRVSDTFFPVFGLPVAQGRAFTRQEEAAGHRLAVISHEFWAGQMGSDPSAIGQSLTLDQESFEIIGIMPPTANLLYQMNQIVGIPGGPVDVYLPLEPFASLQGETVSTLNMVGRMTEGATLAQTRSEAERFQAAFLEARGGTGWLTSALGLKEFLVGSSRTPLLILLGSVAVLLMMVCVNLAGLLLARGVGRSREWAARRALGASQRRIVRQLLTEGGVVSATGGLLGIGFAYWVLSTIRLSAPAALPRVEELALDWRAVLLSMGLASLAAVLFGLVPALFAARRPPAAALSSSRQGLSTGGRQVLKGLVLVEVTLAVVLLAGSGVLLRSLGNLVQQDPGYSAQGVLRGTTALPADRYDTDADVNHFANQVREQLAAVPGVESVAASMLNTATSAPRNGFQIDGVPGDEGRGTAMQNSVTPDYFRTMDIALLDGRYFTEADGVDAPGVAIITNALQEAYWPGESAVGKRVQIGSWRYFMRTGAGTPPVVREIVGVVEDLTGVGLDPGQPVEMLYSPFAQDPFAQHTYLIRTAGSPAALAASLRSIVAEVDPNQPVFEVEPLLESQRAAIGRERLSALVLGGFAVVALLLSGLGIYGVVTYSVLVRKQEIGIRMAVGADPGSVVRLFLREGLGPVLVGLLAGLAVALGTVQFVQGLLYEVSPVDPVSFAGAGVVLGLAALAATYLPARSTVRVDPAEVLRPQ